MSSDDALSSLEDCFTGSNSEGASCYNTAINAEQLVTGIMINLCIGALCYVGFVLWRGSFRVYFGRLVSPFVSPAHRPPALRLGSHWQLWSWLLPVFNVSDQRLLETVGLDALVAQRVIGFGISALTPLTILGIGVLLPINYTSYVPPAVADNSTSAIDDAFLRMTMSSVPSGSKLLWVHFFFTYFFIGWVCWLIIYYYKEFISLRQAHDQMLIESTDVGRRCSLLDSSDLTLSSQPIMSHDRLASMARRTTLGHGAAAVAAAALAETSAAAGSSAAGSGGSPQAPWQGSGAAGAAAGLPQSYALSGSMTSRGSRAVPRSAPTPVSSISSGMHISSATLVHRHTPAAGGAAGSSGDTGSAAAADQPAQALHGGGGGSGATLFADALSGPVVSSDIPAVDVMPRSPFESEDDAVPLRLGATRHSLQTITDQTEGGEASADVEAGAGAGDGGSGSGSAALARPSPPPRWGELAQPLMLVQRADAAQFYAVLLVDEAIESFSHVREDRLWIEVVWEGTCKALRQAAAFLARMWGQLKALAKREEAAKAQKVVRAVTAKEREHVDACNRRMQVAEDLFSSIFAEDFDRIVPVYKTKGADALLARWNAARLRLDRLQQQQREVARERARLREEVAAAIADADRRLAELEQQQPQQQEEEQGGIADAEEGAAGGSANGSGALNNASALQGALSGMTAASGQLPGEADDGDGGSAKPSPTRSRGTAWHARGCDWACGPPSAAAQEKRALKLKARAEKLAGQVHATEKKLEAVQAEFERCQLEAAEAKPAPCFFAAFHTAHAAAYAARLNLNPLHERMMRVLPAPAPRNVNFPALFRSWAARGVRPIPVYLAVLIMLLLPIGLFAGVCGTIVSALCGNTNPTGDLSAPPAEGSWFCGPDWFATLLRNLISSTLPSILLSVWQALVLPIWFYTCAQAEAVHYSLSSLELRMANWFFLHDFFNVFLGGMLGGSIVWAARAVLNDPSQFFSILGQAVPASSNFFVNYVSFRGIAMSFFRLFFPHAMVFGSILKWLRIVPSPKTEMGREAAAVPISCRYSRDLGVLQLTVYLVTLAYGVVTPIILPFGLFYFLMWWPVWRYQMLYVYQAHYDCQGHFWVYCAHRIVVCLGVMAAFTAAILAVKAAYVQGLVLLCTAVAFLWWFDRYLTYRYDNVVDQVPAVGIHHAPRAHIDAELYVPPPMRNDGAGWSPDWGKAWVGYGVPRYGL